MFHFCHYLALSLICLGVVGILLNLTLISIIIRSPLLRPTGQPVFIHILSILIGKTIQLMIIVFYIAPSIALQLTPFGDYQFGVILQNILSYLFYTLWVHSCCSNTLLSFSRFVIIIFSDSWISFLCSNRNVILLQTIFIWFLAATLALVTQFILPCCHVLLSHSYYGYAYAVPDDNQKGFNYSKYYVNLPANIVHTIIFILFYAGIVFYLCRKRVRSPLSSHRETDLAIQFFCIATFFSLTWISFNLLPNTSYHSAPATLMLVFDCGVSALIYLTMNRDVRKHLYRRRNIGKGDCICRSHSISTLRSHSVCCKKSLTLV